MWEAVYILLLPAILVHPAVCIISGSVPSRQTKINRRIGTRDSNLQNEVSGIDFSRDPGRNFVADDYTDFNNEPIRNSEAGGKPDHSLTQVTYEPIAQENRGPEAEDFGENTVVTLSPVPVKGTYNQAPVNGLGQPQNTLRSRQYIGARGTVGTVEQLHARNELYSGNRIPRNGYFFQHYPWWLLPKPYRTRPFLPYVYPRQYSNAVYSYKQRLPFSDPYNIYGRNPQATGYGCGQAGGCSSGGCGEAGGCGDGTSATFIGDSIEYEDDNRSGETRINKLDPLEDLDIEDLERLSGDKIYLDDEELEKVPSHSSTEDFDLFDDEEAKRVQKTSRQ